MLRVNHEELRINRNHSRPRRRMETVSLRISTELRSILEEEAIKNGVSFTSLVSQVLGRYVSWGRYAEKMKFVPASKDMLRELFQLVPKESIPDIAKRLGETSAHEEVLFLYRQRSLENTVRFLDVWSSHFATEHNFDGKTHFYTLHHDVNMNYSIFIKEYVSSLIQSTMPREVHFEAMSANAVSFSFET